MKYFALFLFMFLATSLVPAETIQSPLALVPDTIGADLQETFISAPQDIANKKDASFIAYRKTFALPSAPQSGMLHIFADVRYILWINGSPVHRGPNRFDTRGPEYDTVDIAKFLRQGGNAIAVVVMGNASNARMMKHAPGLTLRIDVDGSPTMRTDTTWKWSDQTRYQPAKVTWAQIIDRIDTRVEDGDWTQPAYDDKAWKQAVQLSGDSWGPLSARRIPMLRDTPVVPRLDGNAALPLTLAAGEQLRFSMDRLVQAYTILTVEADIDTELVLNYAGVEYNAKPGRQVYISSDSCAFDGGAITVKVGRARIIDLKLIERLYPFDRLGSFKSNDLVLNQLWDVCARSLEILSEDAYVDCAERERAEWMDCDPPDFDVTRTAFAATGPDGKPLYADARLLGEMLRRTALSVQKEGWVKAHTTSDRFDIHAKMEDRSCDWVQGARRYYESTGDKALIHEIWPVIVQQMDYFLARRTPRGLILAREWVVWGNPVGYVTCEGAGLNAFVYKALADAAYLGAAIDESKDAQRFDKEAKDLAGAFNTVLWNEQKGTYYSGYNAEPTPAKILQLKVENNLIEPTMFSALWALDQGLVPPDRRARVTNYLLSNRAQASRIMTFYYLYNQMYKLDTDEFDREILQSFRTRWKAQAESRWQTTWEEFRGGSKAHCYGMFPGYFLSAYVLGVRPDLPVSNKRIIIEPRLGDLSFAEGAVVTEFGVVPVSWEIANGTLTFRVQVPTGVTAILRIPKKNGMAKLTFAGKAIPMTEKGRYFEATVGEGIYEGQVSYGEK